MELVVPYNSSSLVYRKPTFNRRSTSNYQFYPSALRCKTMSELQTPVGVTDRTGSYSSPTPTHKVTIHGRERGVVHEFLVPEVGTLLLISFRRKFLTLNVPKLESNWNFILCASFRLLVRINGKSSKSHLSVFPKYGK